MFDALDRVASDFATLVGADQVAAWEIAAGWAAAGQARARAAVAPTTKAAAADLDADLQLRAGSSRHKGADGARLVANPVLLGELQAGRISPPAAAAVARQLEGVPAGELAATTHRVLDGVVRDHGRNVRVETWQAEARRVVDVQHPKVAADRACSAFEGRCLSVTGLGDDMAQLVAVLRADVAQRILRAAQGRARRSDPRVEGTSAWRTGTVDAFAEICLGVPEPAPGTCAPSGAGPSGAAPSDPPPMSPVPGPAPSLLQSRQPDLFGGEPAVVPEPPEPPAGAPRWAGGGPLKTVVFVTMSREAADGTTETPALLHGVGKISADLARSYLGAPGTLVVEVPLTADGRADMSSPRLGCGRGDPFARSADLMTRLTLIARDHWCRFEGCWTPAFACDADHVVDWALGGLTVSANLQSGCGRDHALKGSAECTVTGDADGTLTITLLSTGRVYQSRPPVVSPEHLWGVRSGPAP